MDIAKTIYILCVYPVSGSIANVICSEPFVKVITHLLVSILAVAYTLVAVFKSPISGLPELSKLIIVSSTHPPLKAIDIFSCLVSPRYGILIS